MESNTLLDNINRLKDEIALAASTANRNQDEIKLMAVSKNATTEQIIFARKSGIDLFGENYINQAVVKLPVLFDSKIFSKHNFHMIGHLQGNKVKKATSFFSGIDSVDSLQLANKIANELTEIKEIFPIMLEIKTAIDENKYGFNEKTLIENIPELLNLEKIKINGLMTIASLDASEKETRRCFAKLRKLKEKIKETFNFDIPFLSMGMSEDYKIAIEEGSNLIRIGRAIFGG